MPTKSDDSALMQHVKELTLQSRDLAMLAAASNYDVADKVERRRSATELSLLFFQIARALEVDLFVEAGAKDASSSRRARRLLAPQRIVAFEANPFTFAEFERQHDNSAHGVEYLHLALSDAVGSVTFNVNTTPDGQPRHDGQGSLLKPDVATAGQREVTVEATTLDRFFAADNFSRAALWVDVEGATGQVLRGARGVLDRSAVVILEVEERQYWESQWLRRQTVSYLYDRGLLPYARDFQSRYQYNIVFVRSELMDHDRLRWLLARHLSSAAARRPAASTLPPDASSALKISGLFTSSVAAVRGRLTRRLRG
jgi:FkbM family methyltransferase